MRNGGNLANSTSVVLFEGIATAPLQIPATISIDTLLNPRRPASEKTDVIALF